MREKQHFKDMQTTMYLHQLSLENLASELLRGIYIGIASSVYTQQLKAVKVLKSILECCLGDFSVNLFAINSVRDHLDFKSCELFKVNLLEKYSNELYFYTEMKDEIHMLRCTAS